MAGASLSFVEGSFLGRDGAVSTPAFRMLHGSILRPVKLTILPETLIDVRNIELARDRKSRDIRGSVFGATAGGHHTIRVPCFEHRQH